MGTKTLESKSAVDSVTFGTKTYAIRDGFVVVPNEAVEGLLSTGGFVIASDQVDIGNGLVPLYHDDKGASASWGGKTVSIDEDGLWYAPAAAVGDLLAHGFKAVTVLESTAKKANDEAAKKAAEDEAKRVADEEAKKAAEEDEKKKAAEEDEKKKAAAEAKKKADDDAKKKADDDATKKAEEDAAAKKAADDAAKNGGLTVVEPGTSTPKKTS